MPPVSLALLHFFLFWTYLNKRKQYLKKKKSLALLDIVYYLFVLHQNCDIIRFQTEPVVEFLNGGSKRRGDPRVCPQHTCTSAPLNQPGERDATAQPSGKSRAPPEVTSEPLVLSFLACCVRRRGGGGGGGSTLSRATRRKSNGDTGSPNTKSGYVPLRALVFLRQCS